MFLAIDNVCNESLRHAEALLQMGFHPQSLVIVTSRDATFLKRLGIHEECCFEMPGLDINDARAIVFNSAPPGCHKIFSSSKMGDLDKLVERGSVNSDKLHLRQYVPLALEVLGRHVPMSLTNSRADINTNSMSSVLRLSFDNLRSSMHRDIFLDVALCVPRLQDNTPASVSDVCKWLSMVYHEDFDAILRIVSLFYQIDHLA